MVRQRRSVLLKDDESTLEPSHDDAQKCHMALECRWRKLGCIMHDNSWGSVLDVEEEEQVKARPRTAKLVSQPPSWRAAAISCQSAILGIARSTGCRVYSNTDGIGTLDTGPYLPAPNGSDHLPHRASAFGMSRIHSSVRLNLRLITAHPLCLLTRETHLHLHYPVLSDP